MLIASTLLITIGSILILFLFVALIMELVEKYDKNRKHAYIITYQCNEEPAKTLTMGCSKKIRCHNEVVNSLRDLLSLRDGNIIILAITYLGKVKW